MPAWSSPRRWASLAGITAATLVAVVLLAALLRQPVDGEWPYARLISEVEAGRVEAVTIEGTEATATTGDRRLWRVTLPTSPADTAAVLRERGVKVEERTALIAQVRSALGWTQTVLLIALSGAVLLVLLTGVGFLLRRQS